MSSFLRLPGERARRIKKEDLARASLQRNIWLSLLVRNSSVGREVFHECIRDRTRKRAQQHLATDDDFATVVVDLDILCPIGSIDQNRKTSLRIMLKLRGLVNDGVP